MKKVYHYNEIDDLVTQGKQVAFTAPAQVRVTAVQKSQDSDEITVTIHVLQGEYVVAECETTYPRIEALLDAFDIDDLAEIWEVLEQ